jgi:aldehyde dehydrogenase (NAD+)
MNIKLKGGAYLGCSQILAHGKTPLITRNPANGQVLDQLNTCNQKDVFETLLHSQKAFKEWAVIPAPQRAKVLERLKQKIQNRQAKLAELITLEMGKIIAEAQGEIQEILDMIDFAIGQSRMLYGKTMHSERPKHRIYEQWHPFGVVAILTAFNFPMAVWAWNACLAIIGGNAVIWKPSSQTPLCAIEIQELCIEVMRELQIPDIFSLIITESHEACLPLLESPQVQLVSFTGSCKQGQYISEKVHQRLGKTILELGGNNAVIIDDSANIDLAIQHVFFGALATAGQRCTSTRRVIVHHQYYSYCIQTLQKMYAKIQIGNPLEPHTQMGPLIHQKAQDVFLNTIEAIQNTKAKILTGGEILSLPGYFVEPTIVAELEHAHPLVQMETFAPILYLFSFQTIEEAIEKQNAVPQGLSSALFTQNLLHAELFLSAKGSDCGIANINTSTAGAEISIAFGGEKQTGGGREAGSDSWKNYMRRQSSVIHWGNDFDLAQNLKF